MQRFFSTFPNEWPGAGLLLLRMTLGWSTIAGGFDTLQHSAWNADMLPTLFEGIAGLLLIAGLWTPFAALTIYLLELVAAFTDGHDTESLLFHAAVGLSLVLLGPGAWSIDARLFGRRSVEIKRLRDG